MYPATAVEAKAIFLSTKRQIQKYKKTKVIICPPFIFTGALTALRGKSKSILLGAQNSFFEDEGAYTGEVSPKQLASLSISHVILGHSERRALGESDEMISQKINMASKNKLTSILCVGERTRDEAGAYFKEVSAQLRNSLFGFPKNQSKYLIVAYEPVWAIGKHAIRPATPSDFQEMSILIRRYLVEHFGKVAGFRIPILYGGSVDEKNAVGFLRDGGANGLLVGRVSLDAQKFNTILQLADNIK